MDIKTLYANAADIRKYVQGLDASVDLSTLTPPFTQALRYVRSTLTQTVFDALLITHSSLVKECVANLLMFNYSKHEALRRRQQGTELYRYELEQMQSDYLDNFQSSLDELFSTAEISCPEWANTPISKRLSALLVNSVQEFSTYYPIGSAYYFFYLTIAIQSEVIANQLFSIDYLTLESIQQSNIKRACVFYTIALAIARLDYSQLPCTIRNNRVETSSRGADDRLSTLARSLRA
ncbi:MAG: hypothetical protein RR141_00270, partial [Rikenellaceae bacterium]